MADVTLEPGSVLLVAARGTEAQHGLYRWQRVADGWQGTQLARAQQLSALASHPTLPVVYGTSGTGAEGLIHAWRIVGGRAEALGEVSSGGAEPCYVAVDPAGRLLVVTNYSSSTLAVQRLGADGSFAGPVMLLPLVGSSIDTDRQEAAHPHQAVFAGGMLHVIDLGADLLRSFAIEASDDAIELVPGATTSLPPGTGPRHGAMLPDGRFAISGELAATVLAGRPGTADWAVAAGTERTGPAKTRHLRNYPGDIQRSADGRHVYFANRGHDTIATFDVSGSVPRLVSEQDATVKWPQHLLVLDTHLLVAGWDSSAVVALPLVDGVAGPAETLFACPGAGWVLLFRGPSAG